MRLWRPTMYDQPSQPSVTGLIGTVLIFMIVAAYGFMALNTEDALWFWPKFEEKPSEIVVFCYGEPKVLSEGTPHLAEITSLLNEIISGPKNWDTLSMSDETYAHYQTGSDSMVLEARYSSPVRIHTTYKYFSHVGALVIPLDGRHAQTYAVFGRTGTEFTAGSLHVETIRPLKDYLSSEGICSVPFSSD